ncbi:uncharacterized protein LOC103707596 isoform X3 [Phoenix dactylifera]|uniref:Uncharacterized protein LOC103707596 isoform X3 n=1 Tax=Phoenix dactylifera TaxID=42345 RepID=A0A8B7C2S9_PHODC|nr:uncharacterized protein LOC103707596 isoform X3 [Phoenix dactylifera]
MLLRGSGVVGGGALRRKSPAVESIKAMSRSPTSTFCAGGQAAPSRSGGGSNDDRQSLQQEPVTTGGGSNDDRQSLQQEPVTTTGDAMSHSFGEGYSTRSDEEGFGGIYGRNQSISRPGELDNHPDYDKSQGSEVKEKEKGRNQP